MEFTKRNRVPQDVYEENEFSYMRENNNGYETGKKNVNNDVDRVDEMMEEVEYELEKHPRVFDLFIDASLKPL